MAYDVHVQLNVFDFVSTCVTSALLKTNQSAPVITRGYEI